MAKILFILFFGIFFTNKVCANDSLLTSVPPEELNSVIVDSSVVITDTLVEESILDTVNSDFAIDTTSEFSKQISHKLIDAIVVASPYTRTQQQLILSRYNTIVEKVFKLGLKNIADSLLYSKIEPLFNDTLEILIFVDSCRIVDLDAPNEASKNIITLMFEEVKFPCDFNNVSYSFNIVFGDEEFDNDDSYEEFLQQESKYSRYIKRHSNYNFYVKVGWENNGLDSLKPALTGVTSFYRGTIIDSTRLFQDFNRTVGSYTLKAGVLFPFEFLQSISIGASASASLMREKFEAVVMYKGTNRYFSETAQYKMVKYSLYFSAYYKFNPYFISLDAYDDLYFKFMYGNSYNSVFEFSRLRDGQTISRISGEPVSEGIYDFSLLFFRQPAKIKYSLEAGYRTELVSSIKSSNQNRELVYRDFLPGLSESDVQLHLSGIYFRLGLGF